MKRWILGVLVVMGCVSMAWADSFIVGHWVTMDEKTGAKRAVVRLVMKDGELQGSIDTIYPTPGDTGICSLCPGQFKDKPTKGLTFIWGLKQTDPKTWEGGEILDPKTGKIYRAKMTVKGDHLYVRGYVGIALLGRTQVWVRE